MRPESSARVIAMKATGPGSASLLRRLSVSGAFVVVLAVARASTATAADVTKLLVGLSSTGNTSLALFIAKAGGFNAERGFDVDTRVFDAGSRGAAELQAGRLDIMHVGLSAVIELDRAGADLRLIASLVNVVRFSLFVAPGVTTAADLKGAVMAVSGFGSESDSTMRLALSRLGLKQSDVVLKEFSGTASRVAALKSGDAKGAMLAEPTATMARNQGLRALVDLAAERIPWVFSALVVRRSDLAGRRDLLKRFLQATIEGAYLGLSSPTRAKEALGTAAKITDPAILASSYDEFKRETPLMLEATREEADNVLAQFPGGSNRIEDYVDASLVNELKQEGFFTAMERKYRAP
jgi:NitT/TauT family transport system substrate-binding protein